MSSSKFRQSPYEMLPGGDGIDELRSTQAQDVDNSRVARNEFWSARVYHSLSQTITTALATVLAFNNTRWDTDDIHDDATNNSRLTCKTAGKYQVTAGITWVGNATGQRQLRIIVNGTTIWALESFLPRDATAFAMSIITILNLSINDYVEVQVYQDSGGNLDVSTFNNYSPEFMMVWIGN